MQVHRREKPSCGEEDFLAVAERVVAVRGFAPLPWRRRAARARSGLGSRPRAMDL